MVKKIRNNHNDVILNSLKYAILLLSLGTDIVLACDSNYHCLVF
jgi:hypothetical protein